MADEKTPAKVAEKKDDLISVISATLGKVALYERDPQHPDGEAFVAYDKPVKVFQTPMVLSKLASGELIKV